ncbi:MAG: glutamate synthase subunit beta [Sumerlaeia bacterium]
MGKPTGFMELDREKPPYRPIEERIQDWKEVNAPTDDKLVRDQTSRCMDCGIPFCNQGCPLGNLIPEWNDHVYRGRWADALASLLKTNNFPEFTGRICPAPCEASCVLNKYEEPVTIKLSEVSIIDRAFAEGLIHPEPPAFRTGKSVAVIGSGPAGLAAAAQLNKAGHLVTVFERAQRAGGLLTFGIPDFKLDKKVVDRRLGIMEEEGIRFRCGVNIGFDVTMDEIRREFDAVVFAMGSTKPRDLPVPGRELDGVHFAMDFLVPQNEENYGDRPAARRHISAKDKHVIILGGGDTGADCLGTSHRHGAASVHQFELMPKPPTKRDDNSNPWPQWPMVLRTSSAHEEGGIRDYSIQTTHLSGKDGKVTTLHGVRLEWKKGADGRMGFEKIPGSEFEMAADLVLLAMGFVHPEKEGPIEQAGCELDARGNVKTNGNYQTSQEGIFAAGDCRRGQSLVVWAIAEGRKAARAVDQYLMGESDLPG